MRILLNIALATLALAACEPKKLIADAPQGAQAVTDCAAHAEKAWKTEALGEFMALADTAGPSCPQAMLTLAVRAGDGSLLLAWASRAQDIFGVGDAADRTAMTTALGEWIDQSNASYKTTADLEEWPKGAAAPGKAGEEFPMHPEAWIDQASWEELRKQKKPVFSFPQGRESIAVMMLNTEPEVMLEQIGVKQFPG